MSVKYVLLEPDHEFVSKPWHVLLKDMRADGVAFTVLEGHRTMARQRWFWNCYKCKCCNNGNVAAFPSPFAPHIRTGRIDHAIDFSSDAAVFAWLQSKGLRPARTVAGESWHIECDADALRAYAKKHGRDVYDSLPRHVEFAVRRLLHHRKEARDEARTGKGPKYRKQVKWRNFWRGRVERMHRRAARPKVERILAGVLAGQ
jgi:hypothetical protein